MSQTLNVSQITNMYNQFVSGMRNKDGSYVLDENNQAKFQGIDADIQGLLSELKTDPNNMVAMLQLQSKMGTLASMTSLSSNMVKSMTEITKELARAIS